MRLLMRRLTLVPLLVAGLLLAPAGAHAATPGVNVSNADPAELSKAQALGAKYVRLFVRGDKLTDYATFKAVLQGASQRGMQVVFVVTGNADGSNAPPDD
jgi:hypothetical protein